MSETIVDFPELKGDTWDTVLLNFYRSFGWSTDFNLDPTKVKLYKEDWDKLLEKMEACADDENDLAGIRFQMINVGPSSGKVPEGKVLLEEGWLENVS